MYAIKIIDKCHVPNVKKVLGERQILSMVDHPFVISMQWAFQDNARVYFALEFASGGDLASLVRDIYPHGMPEKTAMFYVVEILLALEYLHSMDIVFRDLKPENVLTTEAGHVKVTDFGISFREQGSNSNLSGDVSGTPNYMAPEVLNGKSQDKMVDYWALGIITFELIHAFSPWWSEEEGATIHTTELLFRILTRDVFENEPSTPPLWTQLSRAARNLIYRLLEKDPHLRLGMHVTQVKTHEWFTQYCVDWDAALRSEMVPPQRKLPSLPAPGPPPSSSVSSESTNQLASSRHSTDGAWEEFEAFNAPPVDVSLRHEMSVQAELVYGVPGGLLPKVEFAIAVQDAVLMALGEEHTLHAAEMEKTQEAHEAALKVKDDDHASFVSAMVRTAASEHAAAMNKQEEVLEVVIAVKEEKHAAAIVVKEEEHTAAIAANEEEHAVAMDKKEAELDARVAAALERELLGCAGRPMATAVLNLKGDPEHKMATPLKGADHKMAIPLKGAEHKMAAPLKRAEHKMATPLKGAAHKMATPWKGAE